MVSVHSVICVLAYVKAYYGMDAYHDKWLAAYDMHLTRIKGGDYK